MIVNRQRIIDIPLPELEKFLARVRRRLHLPKDSLTVCLVTGAQIARWNRAYRGKNRPTDVLSFPANVSASKRSRIRSRTARAKPSSAGFEAAPNASRPYLGDIAIAPAIVKRNARRLHRTFSGEMRILILHGILHLMGYDHEADEGQMDRREQRLRRELGLV
jgi:probable rRNA maturation factor